MDSNELIARVLKKIEERRKRRLTEEERGMIKAYLEGDLRSFHDEVMREYEKAVEGLNKVYMNHFERFQGLLDMLNQPNPHLLALEIMSEVSSTLTSLLLQGREELGSSVRRGKGGEFVGEEEE